MAYCTSTWDFVDHSYEFAAGRPVKLTPNASLQHIKRGFRGFADWTDAHVGGNATRAGAGGDRSGVKIGLRGADDRLVPVLTGAGQHRPDEFVGDQDVRNRECGGRGNRRRRSVPVGHVVE